MTAERLMRMALNLLMRRGMRFLSRRGKTDPKMAEAAKKLRMGRRIGRF